MDEEKNTLIKENEVEKIIEEDEIDLHDNNYEKYILDLSLSYETRIKLIHRYYTENQNNAIEIISRISGMYQFSGAKILEKYLIGIALETNLSDFLNVEAVKGLLSFTEFEEDIYEKDDDEMKEIKTESNDAIKQRNELRQNIAYETLNNICSRLNDDELATPYKIDVICSLMENEKYKEESSQYFIKVISDDRIECDYRYKTILSLERKKINNIEFHLYKSLISFLRNINNLMMYRILSSQYLLQSIKELMTEDKIKEVEQNLLEFAENENNEYNLRADASDVLLSLGSEEMKIKGREIILKLGGKGKTIFDNKQNVHVKEIEKSVMNILETICYVPIIKNDKKPIDFDYVDEEIQKLIKDTNDKEKILISLNRIRMDRTLYSALSITLSVVMVKLWSYICSNENKNELQNRLLQELEDMAGTCSSGFISRLVNTISGFGELSIKISFEDQIVSNFSARLNSYAQKICDNDSVFRDKAFDDVKKLYLKENPEKKTYVDIVVEEFYDSVLNEMMLSSSDYKNRPSFLLFFRTYMSKIREEMFTEFIDYVSESEFDLYFRKALSYYDGIRDVV